MKLVLWGTHTIFVSEDIAKSYKSIHGENIHEKEAEALLLTEGISKDSCISNEHIRKNLEKLMAEDVTINRQLARADIRETARRVMVQG